jgi:hypothetical protein
MDQTSSNSVDIKVGALTVYSSGLVHVTAKAPLVLTYGGLVMEFSFDEDSTKEPRYALVASGSNKLTCKLSNFANNLGQGRIDAIKLGTLNQHELWTSFYVWTINVADGLRLVSYVLYLGAPVTPPTPVSTEVPGPATPQA